MSGKPLLISSFDTAARATVLEPVPFGDTSIDEGWLQRLIERHPEVLPLAELDHSFGPLKVVARELPTGVGPLDILAISPAGFLTIVETKLYRNPQSRREVLGQILDYCARLAVFARYVVHPELSEKNGGATQPFRPEETPDEAPS